MKKLIFVWVLLTFSVSVSGQNDQQLALTVHNEARAELGVSPLSLSNELANDAEAYAKKLARLDKGLIHSKSNRDGENLYMSYGSIGDEVVFSDYPFKDASLSWYAEKLDYSYAKVGDEPDFGAIGHYTQMIWKTTTLVGFGYARSKSGKEYVVARYAKAGNIKGDYPY